MCSTVQTRMYATDDVTFDVFSRAACGGCLCANNGCLMQPALCKLTESQQKEHIMYFVCCSEVPWHCSDMTEGCLFDVQVDA